jgi:phage terminase large subunit-like protein
VGTLKMFDIDQKKYPFCYEAQIYADDVVNNRIVTNIYIKSICAKYFTDLNNKKLFLDLDWAEKFLRMFQKFSHVIGVGWKSSHILLEPWQLFIFFMVEGFYWKNNGKRKYKTLHLEVARGNGKSAMSSVVGLIYLCLYRDVVGNKVYAASTKKEQARIVLDSAMEMAKNNSAYLKHTGAEVFAHHIAHKKTGSEFRALSSDSKSLDGLQPILGIIDELHAHRDRSVYDVIDSAMSKRKDSMLMVITTAGFSLEGIGYSQSQYAKKVALGKIPDETFLPFVYTLDEDDDWRDEKTWIKANPNWGISVDEDAFHSKAFKAKANPSDEANFLVKHLNMWQNAASQFFNVKAWDLSSQKDLKIEDFIGESCYVGVDLANGKDLTSVVYIFKKDMKFYVFAENYCPEDTVLKSKNVNYKRWSEEGLIITTPGKTINYEFIENRFIENSKKFRIKEAFFDSWNATEFSQRMSSQRIEMVEFRMNTANLSEPMKKLDAAIIDGNVVHDGSELMSWCLSNVVAKVDHNNNIFPRKDHENMKIDPIVASIMAIAGWVNEDGDGSSIYNTREMVFI